MMTTITVSNEIPDIIINGTALYEELGLVPKTRPVIPPPEPITTIVEVPGSINGPIDMTGSLTPYIQYNDINGSLEFYVDFYKTGLLWKELYDSILQLTSTNLRNSYLILTDDPDWRYVGNIIFESFSTPSDGKPSTVKLKYRLRPWQEEKDGTTILKSSQYIIEDLSSYAATSYGGYCSTYVFNKANAGAYNINGIVGYLHYQSVYFHEPGSNNLDRSASIIPGSNYIPDFIIGRYNGHVQYVPIDSNLDTQDKSNVLCITLRKRRLCKNV